MANEETRTSFDINQAVSEAVASAMSSITESISNVIDTRLQAFKEENSQTVEAAVKRARHDRYEFKSKGNKQQYDKRMKVIKMADKSQYSWATVEEYLSDELASDTDDEKRIIRSENRAAKKAKEAKKKKTNRNRFNYRPNAASTSANFQRANQSTSQMQFSRSEPYWRPHGMLNSRQEGPCYKLSICFCI